MTTIVEQINEVLTDLGSEPDTVLRRGSFLKPAMGDVIARLERTADSTEALFALIGMARGQTPDEIAQTIRHSALGGSFALGVLVGQELQKRGYTPPVDGTMDEPSV